MRQVALMTGMALALAGCGAADDGAQSETMAASIDAAAPTADRAESAADAGTSPIAVSLPQIAYVYDYGFRLASDAIAPLQMRHADLCEAQGPSICRIIDMRQHGMEGDYAGGSLTLSVAASRARAFGTQLSQMAEGSGGEQISSTISGEDLSKRIVDTEARLRARTVLRDRLLEVLQTRRGTVRELVEAERSVAQVNEEIDQAQSWLAEMKGHVAFSRVSITYSSGAPVSGGFTAPVRAALASISGILGVIVAGLITLATIALPLGLIGWLGWLTVRLLMRWRAASSAAKSHSSSVISD
ncbi:hypothetical protein GCM10010990_24130 [Croceicoccus mobilis]|uniref:DUF4349 domain-containing protein n=2 Tax=Croceicoccus mobilis TaxID=1703339 RepID=A0A916Z318_9SPHN|nr:hypothetical protein GCM10010990_24130 [Croceicoccus mobilis]